MDLQTGIIIKTNKYKESSKIAYILTKDGLINVLIRNSLDLKSKNFSYSNELAKIEFNINKSKRASFDTLTSGVLLDNYSNIKMDIEKLTSASNILYLIYKSSEYVSNNRNMFDLVSFYFDNLNNTNSNLITIYNFIFNLKLLYLLGIGPNLKTCTVCEKEKTKYLSLLNGGCVCDKCKGSISSNDIVLESDALSLFKILYLVKLSNVNDDYLSSLLKETEKIDSNGKIINEIKVFIKEYYKKYLAI